MCESRYSHWRRKTDEARRAAGEWINVGRLYTEKTAYQLCSDIRKGRRIVGIMPGEVFHADWVRTKNDNDDFEVFIRLAEPCTTWVSVRA